MTNEDFCSVESLLNEKIKSFAHLKLFTLEQVFKLAAIYKVKGKFESAKEINEFADEETKIKIEELMQKRIKFLLRSKNEH